MKSDPRTPSRVFVCPGGILRWSTAFILAGGVGLSSCNRGVNHVMEDGSRAVGESSDQDPVKKQLESGLVENNFELPKVGYYHAAVNRFYDTSYNQYQDGKWYVNGSWEADPGVDRIPPSRPLPEELKRVEAALEEEQKAVAQNPQAAQQGGSGMGMGNALMMFWLLSGNRGFFSPGAAFQRASTQAPEWQRSDSRQGGGYSGYGGSGARSSGYDAPSTTRGGFGSRSSGFSFGG